MSLYEGYQLFEYLTKVKSLNLFSFVTKPWVVIFRSSHPKRRLFLPWHITPCKGIQSWPLDSSPGISDSRYWIPIFCQSNLNSRFQSFVGFRIPWAVFRIPRPKIPDCTSKTSRILESLTWCETYRKSRTNFKILPRELDSKHMSSDK